MPQFQDKSTATIMFNDNLLFETQPLTEILQPEIPVLSVTELSYALKRHVEGQFNKVQVQGEISGLKRHTSGHSYFALKDQDSVLDGICWRGTSLGITLEEGLEIIAQGRLTTYPGRSKYQIVVESARAAGQGALLKLLMERKVKLEAEGLFLDKKPLPPFPNHIGIVTSPTGAVIKDILHRISDRYPCWVTIWPVLVQGPGAAEQIANAIDGFNNLPSDERPDILIVARGGGSLEDLWAFNEEIVVRSAANSKIPLVSAVGHETDTTLIDFASDLRAPTPTAAAEMITPVLQQLLYTLQLSEERIISLIKRQLQNNFTHLTGLNRGLPDPILLLENASLRLDDWSDRFSLSKITILKNKLSLLENLSLRLRHPEQILQQATARFDQLSQTLSQLYERLFETLEQDLGLLNLCLEQNSYQRVLDRGFCWIAGEKSIVNSAKALRANKDHPIILHFSDAQVKIQPKILEA